MTCFEWLENGLNALDIGVTVLLSDGVQFRLQRSNTALLGICSAVGPILWGKQQSMKRVLIQMSRSEDSRTTNRLRTRPAPGPTP